MHDTFGFDVSSWFVRRMAGNLTIDWYNFEPGREAVAIWPRLMPLLEDDAFVEADTPWQQWLETAQGKKSASPEWLIRRFEGLPVSDRERSEMYDALRLPLRWDLGDSRISRTRNWERARDAFYHTEP